MSARPKYARVGQEDVSGVGLGMNDDLQTSQSFDQGNESVKLTREQRRKKRADRAEWYSTKMHALMWTVAALVTLYFSDIVNVCVNSEKVNRFWFNAGVVCFTIAAVLVLYMAVWVPRVMKIQYDPQVYIYIYIGITLFLYEKEYPFTVSKLI